MMDTVMVLSDGRRWVASLDELSVSEAINLLRIHNIKHVIWVGPFDNGLAGFSGNFSISHQKGDGPLTRHVKNQHILVVGGELK